MNRPRQEDRVGAGESRHHRAAAMLVLAAVVVAAGCNQPPGVNVWRDDSIPASAFGTASSAGILAANVEPAIRQRDFPLTEAPMASCATPHYPLWWEDPLEDKGDQDKLFAVTWQDYVAMPYSLGRFMLNTIGWPVSAVVTPPGTPMVSDAVVGKDHDAAVGRSPDPTAGPEDLRTVSAELPPEEPPPAAAPSDVK